jgi:uncharacterized protein (DUF4213/DUF364 family)
MQASEQATRSSVAARIVDRLAEPAKKVRVLDVRVGLGYTAVQLADGEAGLAYTFRHSGRGGCSVLNRARPLAKKSALDLLTLLESQDAIEAGVGLACANALANRNGGDFVDGDVLHHLHLGPEDHVGMVGHFAPMVATIQRRARLLTVFEIVDRPTELLRPQEDALDELPRCQVALITATSIINHTIDDLLDAATSCRDVVILGASTPLLDDVFAATRPIMLSGVIVEDPAAVLRDVSEGGGTRQLRPHVRKVTLKVGTSHTASKGETE